MTRPAWIVVTPKWTHRSAGITLLHRLARTLEVTGRDVRIAFIDSNDPKCQDIVALRPGSGVNPYWNTRPALNSQIHDPGDAIVVYPDVITGNPLGARHVVRYLCNRPGYCNGTPVTFGATDFVAAYSRTISQSAHILTAAYIRDCFLGERAPHAGRDMDATYIGKGYLYGPVAPVDGTLFIGREWPIDQEQVAMVLRKVRRFYTWDSFSLLNAEAVLCGCLPVVMRYEPWERRDLEQIEIGALPHIAQGEPDMDAGTFEEAREAMRSRVIEIESTWERRVGEFAAEAERHHFGAAGGGL